MRNKSVGHFQFQVHNSFHYFPSVFSFLKAHFKIVGCICGSRVEASVTYPCNSAVGIFKIVLLLTVVTAFM